MENLDRLKGLVHDSNILRTYKKIFKEATSDPNCDKKGMGFNTDNRFAAFQCKVSFDSWRGCYGDPCCYSVIHFRQTDEVVKSLDRYLRSHESEIMNWMANDIFQKANEIKKEALKELESAKGFIDSMDLEDTK